MAFVNLQGFRNCSNQKMHKNNVKLMPGTPSEVWMNQCMSSVCTEELVTPDNALSSECTGTVPSLNSPPVK